MDRVEPLELDGYFHMCDMEKKYTKTPTVWELAQAFPDCREVAVRIVRETKDLCKLTGNAVVDEFIRHEDAYKINDTAKRYLRMTKPDNKKIVLNVESARAVKIDELYDFGKVRKSAHRIQAHCPFHDEKNPSFIIYTNNNSFHCFSCDKGGSSIDFVMHLHHKNFIDAVNFLNEC